MAFCVGNSVSQEEWLQLAPTLFQDQKQKVLLSRESIHLLSRNLGEVGVVLYVLFNARQVDCHVFVNFSPVQIEIQNKLNQFAVTSLF